MIRKGFECKRWSHFFLYSRVLRAFRGKNLI